ncbi:MAG: GNAT family N-acetyltransferase, partial [Oscillospiraceae bacterium]|nr:GNAT family N-acetyltransferase [Oscillospiraceae bacterium]
MNNLSIKIKILSFLAAVSTLSASSLSIFGEAAENTSQSNPVVNQSVETEAQAQAETEEIKDIKISIDKKNIGILEKKPEAFYMVADVWHDAFGYKYGSEKTEGSYMNNFVNNTFLKYDTFVYMHENKCISMLTLIPTQLKTNDGVIKNGYYVYAVGTKNEYRNNGITTLMLDYVDEYAKSNGYDFRILNPDDPPSWLRNFYQKRGYEFAHFRRITMTPKEIVRAAEDAEVLQYQDGLSAKDLFNCRKNNLENKTGFVRWSEKELESVQADYKLAYKNYHELYFGDWQYAIVRFGKPNSMTIVVKEFYIKDENKKSFFKTLQTLFPEKTIVFETPDSDEFSNFFDKSYDLKVLSMFNIKDSEDLRTKS